VGRSTARAVAAGAVHGALLYGSGVSLLHVLHDRVASVWNAAVLFAWSSLLYGLLSAAVFAGAAVAVAALGRVLGGRSAGPPRTAGWRAPLELVAGAFTFNLAFWFLAANYGLTYDELPFGDPAGPVAMLAWLALRTLAVAAAALLAAWVFARLWRRLVPRGGGRLLAAGLYLGLLAVHLALAGLYGPARAAAAAPAALPDPASLRPPHQVALVAADGADWRVIRPLVEAGELPNLARLLAEGAHGPLASLPDSNSAVLWASIYSGLEPADHGVLDFYTVRLAGMTAGVYPVHRTAFKELAGYLEGVGLAERVTVDRGALPAPLLWEVAAAMGRSVGVVDGYYFSYPAPSLPGDESYFLAYGADRFYQRVSRGRRPPSTAPGAEDYARPPALLDELGGILAGWEFDWQSAALLRLLDSRPQPDLVSFYSHQPDAVQHWQWRAYEPERYFRVDPAEIAAHGDDIPAFHRDLDRFLGELRERLEPGTVVILASDHGHSPTLLHAMDSQHRHGPPGILVMAGGPVRRGVALEGAQLYDLFPTILHLLGLPVPETAEGRVLEEALDGSFRAPVARVASYDALLPLFLPAGKRDGESEARRREEELEKLKALGYVR
jgi:hypothetical protein